MRSVARRCIAWLRSWRLSLFEKVILVNSLMLIGEALTGLWVTSHNLETHHYLIDTTFIVLATLLTLSINTILLRASFRPLFSLLATIRAVSAGKTQARAVVSAGTPEISELAQAFNSMLDRLEAASREQAMLIIQAQEEERRRIALELHDEAGQNLTALLIHSEVLNQRFQTLPKGATTDSARRELLDELQQLNRLTQMTLENVRVLAQQLRPSVLDDLGLLAAFRWLAEDSQQRLHLDVTLDAAALEESMPALSAMHETALFRIAQESLTNIARHAQARHATIALRQDRRNICLQIQDDGCGFDERQQKIGTGLIGMRERATLLEGTLTLHSRPGQGTTVQAVLPLAAAHPSEDAGEAQGRQPLAEREAGIVLRATRGKDTEYVE